MIFVPPKTEGAGKAGCPLHPLPRVRAFDEALVGKELDALIAAKLRVLSFQTKLIAELPEDQLRTGATD
jgi:hypothetical protein